MGYSDAQNRVTGPALVFVGGAPGSGKTTLARRLAPALGLPLLCKDALKETLYDTLGLPDEEASRRYGVAATMLLYRVAERLLAAGCGAVLESNFMRPYAGQDLPPLAAQARAVYVHCHATPEETVRRYRERAARGERHPGHHDEAALPRLVDWLQRGVYEPVDLGIPVVRLDTTAGYRPSFEELVTLVRHHAPPRA